MPWSPTPGSRLFQGLLSGGLWGVRDKVSYFAFFLIPLGHTISK